MPTAQPARLLEIHIAEAHQHSGRPLYEVLVERCRELGVAGATVFRGFEGYGETATIHRKHLLTNDQPEVVMIIDSEEIITRILPALEELVDTALITVSQVSMKRVENKRAEVIP
jgi:uncharacterized protein